MLNDMCEQKEATTEQVRTSKGDTKGTRSWRGTRAVGANEDCEIRVVCRTTPRKPKVVTKQQENAQRVL
eukprot:11251710-Ditylum_brightwellii.AAC.1